MNPKTDFVGHTAWPTLACFPLPAKALVTIIILTLALAMAGAIGQIVVHDIIPKFSAGLDEGEPSNAKMETMTESDAVDANGTPSDRGDLFSETSEKNETVEKQLFYQTEQFVWTLKWTHIHLFGMNMIFMFLGTVTLFLNFNRLMRTWLIVLPFVGVLIDIATMWLKGYISPVFFWLHIPGGGLFGVVFLFVCSRALYEMWWMRRNYAFGRAD